jgi:adenylate cyclase
MDSSAERSRSAYQRLVERYIDITSWPTSKKVALLMVYAIPFHLVALGLVRLHRDSLNDILDIARLEVHFAQWLVAVILLALVAIPFARRDREARWTIYLVILVYGGFLIRHIHLFGSMSSPFVFMAHMVILLITLFIDTRAGLVALVFGGVLTASVLGLELNGTLEYAPALTARSIDDQIKVAWISLHWILTLMVAGAILVLLQLSISARDAQREKLRVARERLERSTRLIRRYVPTQLAEKILTGEHTGETQPERRKLTLFFSDVVEFTRASDRMDPEDLTGLLNEYLSEMAAIADSAGATVNQFVGDGIMMFFGAPEATSDRDHALRAVRMSVRMQQRMAELRVKWYEQGIQTPFRIRIGINTGIASVGDFGSEGRTTYSAIGIQTNLTARIQDQCEPGRVLISHSTWALIHDEIPCEERGEIQVKGVHYPVKIYMVAEELPEDAASAE